MASSCAAVGVGRRVRLLLRGKDEFDAWGVHQVKQLFDFFGVDGCAHRCLESKHHQEHNFAQLVCDTHESSRVNYSAEVGGRAHAMTGVRFGTREEARAMNCGLLGV